MAKTKSKKIVFAYVPVLHSGYRRLFDRHIDADKFVLAGDVLKKELDYLRKDIRALPAEDIRDAVGAWYVDTDVVVENDVSLPSILDADEIVAPYEDITRQLLDDFSNKNIRYEKVFLRWHRDNVDEKQKINHETVSAGTFEKEVFAEALREAESTSEWYRRIGAVVAKDNKILLSARNRYGQSPHVVWSEGDPRDTSNRGKDIELSTSLHAERALVAEAARQGIALDGADMYVTTFPCPMCSKMIAASGFKRLYYLEGYVVLDGEDALSRGGVEIFKVSGVSLPDSDDTLPYPEKNRTAD
jgi:dCMP deaminase